VGEEEASMIRANRVEIPQTLEEACDPSRTALICAVLRRR
jgi:hypothetical protein